MTVTTERKYVLTRIGPGDYVLPSNDGKTLWRIARYTDGPSFGLENWPRDKQVWAAWRWSYGGDWRLASPDTLLEWSSWEQWEGTLATRTEAIQAALR